MENKKRMNIGKMPRGAKPSPRHKLAAAVPHKIIGTSPVNLIYIPNTLSFWGNNNYGDCVTAEEAFAKACNTPEIFIPEPTVIQWAQTNGYLHGAYLSEVMDKMATDGFVLNGSNYDDGPYNSVDWTDDSLLQNAISISPVKIGVAADQLENAYNNGNQQNGWLSLGFSSDDKEDHCVSLCGYGSLSWLAQQFNAQLPDGVDGQTSGYALFTWDSIAIIDKQSLQAITREAWLRNPATIIK